MVHLNNVDAMKYMRLSKSRVEVEDIKQIMAKENDNKKTPLGTLELSYIISFPHSFSAELYTLFETCVFEVFIMGQTRPIFVYFRSFHLANIAQIL